MTTAFLSTVLLATGTTAEPLPILLGSVMPEAAKYEKLLSSANADVLKKECDQLKCTFFKLEDTYYVLTEDALGIRDAEQSIKGLKRLEEAVESGTGFLDLDKLSPEEKDQVRAAVLRKQTNPQLAVRFLRGTGKVNFGSTTRVYMQNGSQRKDISYRTKTPFPDSVMPPMSQSDTEEFKKFNTEVEKKKAALLNMNFQYSATSWSTEERMKRLEKFAGLLSNNAAKQQAEITAAASSLIRAMLEKPDEVVEGMKAGELPTKYIDAARDQLLKEGMTESEINKFLETATVSSVRQGFSIGGSYGQGNGQVQRGLIEIINTSPHR